MRVCTKDMRINIENHDNGDMSPNKRQETLAKDKINEGPEDIMSKKLNSILQGQRNLE